MEEEEQPLISKDEKKFLVISGGATLVTVILQIVSLGLKDWVYYCYFKWGLLGAETSDSGLNDLVGGDTGYSNLHDDLCGGYQRVIEAACDGFCGNVKRLEAAGIIFLVFGILSVLLNLFYLVTYFLNGFKSVKTTKNWVLYCGILAASVSYFVGLILYLAIGNIYGMDSTWRSNENVSTKAGLALAYVALILNIGAGVLAYLKVGPLYKPPLK